MIGKRPRRAKAPAPLSEEEVALFRQAVADVRPLRGLNRIRQTPQRPWPEPRPLALDEQVETVDGLSDNIPWYDNLDSGAELVFRRPGLNRQTLRRLRSGHWVIEAQLDLHGYTSDEARLQLAEFLNQCKKRGLRCVRIIHGKGLCSKNKEPVLKIKVRNWLMQREEVLAFCQASPADGGGGAALVLLKASA